MAKTLTPEQQAKKTYNTAFANLKDSQVGELYLLKKYGATAAEIKAETAINKQELQALKDDHADGAIDWTKPEVILARSTTAVDGAGAAFDSTRGVLERVADIRNTYALPYTTGTNGFGTNRLARSLVAIDEGRTAFGKDTTGKATVDMLKRLQAYGETALTAEQIALKGNVKTIKPVKGEEGFYSVTRGFDVGHNDKGSVVEYFKKNADDTYSYVSANRTHQNIANKKGGLGGVFGTVLNVASWVPGLQWLKPIALAYNVASSIANKNPLGLVASAIGAGGLGSVSTALAGSDGFLGAIGEAAGTAQGALDAVSGGIGDALSGAGDVAGGVVSGAGDVAGGGLSDAWNSAVNAVQDATGGLLGSGTDLNFEIGKIQDAVSAGTMTEQAGMSAINDLNNVSSGGTWPSFNNDTTLGWTQLPGGASSDTYKGAFEVGSGNLGSGTQTVDFSGPPTGNVSSLPTTTLNTLTGQATEALDALGNPTGELIPGFNALYDPSVGDFMPAIAGVGGGLTLASAVGGATAVGKSLLDTALDVGKSLLSGGANTTSTTNTTNNLAVERKGPQWMALEEGQAQDPAAIAAAMAAAASNAAQSARV